MNNHSILPFGYVILVWHVTWFLCFPKTCWMLIKELSTSITMKCNNGCCWLYQWSLSIFPKFHILDKYVIVRKKWWQCIFLTPRTQKTLFIDFIHPNKTTSHLRVCPLVDLIYVMSNTNFLMFTSFPTSPVTCDVIKSKYQLVSLSWKHCHHCNFKLFVNHFFIILIGFLVPFNFVDLWTCFIWKEWIFFPQMSKVITSIVISKVPQNVSVIAIWVLRWFIFLVLIEKSLLGLKTSTTFRKLTSWLKRPQYPRFLP